MDFSCLSAVRDWGQGQTGRGSLIIRRKPSNWIPLALIYFTPIHTSRYIFGIRLKHYLRLRSHRDRDMLEGFITKRFSYVSTPIVLQVQSIRVQNTTD